MSSLKDIRDTVKSQLQTAINGLHVYGRWPATINAPAVLVKRVGTVQHTTFAANGMHRLELTMAVPLNELERAQDNLDLYTDASGAKSIITALEADETLDGKAEYILIGEWGEDQSFEHGGTEYLGAVLPVEVHHVY